MFQLKICSKEECTEKQKIKSVLYYCCAGWSNQTAAPSSFLRHQVWYGAGLQNTIVPHFEGIVLCEVFTSLCSRPPSRTHQPQPRRPLHAVCTHVNTSVVCMHMCIGTTYLAPVYCVHVRARYSQPGGVEVVHVGGVAEGVPEGQERPRPVHQEQHHVHPVGGGGFIPASHRIAPHRMDRTAPHRGVSFPHRTAFSKRSVSSGTQTYIQQTDHLTHGGGADFERMKK